MRTIGWPCIMEVCLCLSVAADARALCELEPVLHCCYMNRSHAPAARTYLACLPIGLRQHSAVYSN